MAQHDHEQPPATGFPLTRDGTGTATDPNATMGSTAAYAAFRRWLEAEEHVRALGSRPYGDPEYDAAVSASRDAEYRLAAAQVREPLDLALKVYLRSAVHYPAPAGARHPCMLGNISAPDGNDGIDKALDKAIARDVLAFWPALARLATGDAGAFSGTAGNSPTMPAQGGPDGELLALGRDLETAWAVERIVTSNEDATPEELDTATAPGFAIARKILATPATTLEGLTVKARAVLWCGHDEHEAGPRLFDGETTDIQLAGSIIADLIKAGASASIGEHPDAALLEAWRGYVAGMRAVDAMDGASPEAADQFHAAHIEPHRDVIEQTAARTIAGFAVQLRYLFSKTVESLDGENAALFNDPVTEELADELAGDFCWRMLWRMAEAATRAAAEAGHPLFPADATAGQPEHDTPAADAALLEAFARLLIVKEQEDSPEMAAEESALFNTITSTPAHTLAGVLVKLEWLTNCAWDFGEEEPEMVAVLRTLEEAAGRMGPPVAEAIRSSVQNIQNLARMVEDAHREGRENAKAINAVPHDDDERAVLDAMRGIDNAPRSAFVKAITAFHRNGKVAAFADILEVTIRQINADMKRMPAALASASAAITDMRALMNQQPDHPQDADPFAAAVAEFEQAAPSVLPAVPSAVMVEAGAAAAGIDPTAVRALYAAMVQAHQQERAA